MVLHDSSPGLFCFVPQPAGAGAAAEAAAIIQPTGDEGKRESTGRDRAAAANDLLPGGLRSIRRPRVFFI
jgi:hypothetical protein